MLFGILYIEYMFDISQTTDLLVCYCNLISLMRQYLQEITITITVDYDAYKNVRYTFILELIILVYTAMMISSFRLGTTLCIELNGLKMSQRFGTSRLMQGSILIRYCIYVS